MTTATHTPHPRPRYLFGPVPSRRLGRSLGVDLVPVKVCSFDCVFCQVGRTTEKTLERREYVPVDDVLAEFDAWLASGGKADTVTLAGSGEPTLHSRFGAVLAGIRARCDLRRALLTNSSLLYREEVRRDAAEADIVKVSLSAWDQASFERVNRPAPGLRFDRVLSGLQAFRPVFKGQLWMEIFVVDGVNADADAMERIGMLASRFGPDRIQINTAVRPAADRSVAAVDAHRLALLADCFSPPAEVIAAVPSAAAETVYASDEDVLALLERHPCTAEDLEGAFGLPRDQVAACLNTLIERGHVRSHDSGGRVFYVAVPRTRP